MTLKQKQQLAKVQMKEAIKERAKEFVKRISYFLKAQKVRGYSSQWLEGIKLSDLLYQIPSSKAEQTLSSHYISKLPSHHWCAVQEGLVVIDDTQKPYRYKLIKQQSNKMVLRPYQTGIIDEVVSNSENTLIQLPTGGGKSVIAKEILKQLTADGKKALIVAPKINLLDQLFETFKEVSPQKIHGKNKYNTNESIFVSTLQTAHKKDLGFEPDYILIDEVHHGFSGKMIEQLLQDFKGRLIGLSATPYDKRGELLKGFDIHLNNYNTKYLIEHSYLTPIISYQPIKVDLKAIKITAGDYNLKELDNKFNNIESVSQVIEATKETISQRVQTIVFGINISHTELLAKAYQSVGIDAKFVHSQMSRDEVNEIISSFKGKEFKVLCSVDMLTTGFDVSTVDTIVLARATKSQNLYKQIVGRGLRIAPNKSECVLLDCAGVISDLGMPLKEITPKAANDFEQTSKAKCSECESIRVHRIVRDTKTFKVCAECGHKEEIEPQEFYLCEHCNKAFNPKEAQLIVEGGKILLVCDDCRGVTIVSEVTTQTTLKAIFDRDTLEMIQRRFMASYVSEVISIHGYKFITSQLFKDHSEALTKAIKDDPLTYTKFDREMIQLDKFSVVDFVATTKEDEQLLMNVYRDVRLCFTLYNRLHPEDEASEPLINKVLMQVMNSRVVGIDRLVCKRIKNIDERKQPIELVENFVPYIESRQ